MKVYISGDILERFPSYRLLLIAAKCVQVRVEDKSADQMLTGQEELSRMLFRTEALSQHPHIAAWRKTYASFGSKPSKYRCAAESLLRMVIKKKHLPRINTFVDLCNYVSIKYILPIDAIDTAHIIGDIRVRLACGNERFLPLGSQEATTPYAGEVIYSDDVDVLGRRWNWRKSDKTKVTTDTRNVLITIEGIGRIPTDVLEAAQYELGDLVRRFCNGEISNSSLDAESPQAYIPL